ncbi:MAG: transcriptional regulator [Oscillospiraceae bacterium]|nr:transcriptional regulator [Oscillospiraceae bacterium]
MADGIAHQNKDIIFKILSETYKNKSLSVYGLELPRIKKILPTNLPTLQVDEKRADNIFMLEDDSILILEYESSSDAKNLIKYGHYAFRVTEAYYDGKLRKVTIVVIYTGDIKTAGKTLDLGCVRLQVEQVFLSAFDGEAMYAEIERKVRANEPLSDEDVMRFIILPLTEKKDKQELIEKTVNLAKQVGDEYTQNFIIAGILSATDKFIDKKYSNKLKGWLKMTKVGKLFEEEKIEAINEKMLEVAKTLLEKNVDILTIMESTGLSKATILKIKKTL